MIPSLILAAAVPIILAASLCHADRNGLSDIPLKKSAVTAARNEAPASPPKQVLTPPAAKRMVWANPDSKIYHLPGSRWYGRTKTGRYMPEAEAVKAGYREAK